MKSKAIIIENDETWCFLYRQHLKTVLDVVVIAEFERAEEALKRIPQLCPDVVIADISLPGMSGLEFAQRMQEYPAVKIILVTSHQQEYLSRYNQKGLLVLDKGDIKMLLGGLTKAIAK